MSTAVIESPAVTSHDRLSFTIFLALALHALVILGVSFSIEATKESAPTLNITLATYKSDKAPEKADFLAQHNQQASGTSDKVLELTSETQAEFASSEINQVTPPPKIRASNKSLSDELLSSQSESRKINAQKDPEQQDQERKGEQTEQLQVNPEIASLQAKLAKQRQAYAKRPRIRRLTSVSTQASADAAYLNKWIERVEAIGNDNFPQQALTERIFGNLRLAATIKADGTIDSVEILESSGKRILDASALQIIHLASPFAPFPPEIRKNTDKLEIIRTWRFELAGLSTSQ